MSMYGARSTRRALIDTAVFRAVSQAASIVSFIILVRAMPEHDFGVLSLLYAFIPVISTVASLGLEATMRRYQPEYLQAGNIPAARWLVRFVSRSRFATNILMLAVVLLAWNQFAHWFKLTPYRIDFLYFCPIVLLYFQVRVLHLSLAANMLQRYSAGGLALLSVAKLPSYAVLAWLHVLDLRMAIYADTFAYAVAYVFLLTAYRKQCPTPESAHAFRPDVTERKRLFRYGMLNNFNDAGAMVLSSKSDNFFIAAFLAPVGVGIYSFYSRISQMLGHIQPLRVFDKVIQPVFYAIPQPEADRKIPAYFSLLINTGLILQWPALAYAFALHSEIVGVVFGGKFGDYSYLMPIILSFAAFNVVSDPLALIAQYEEKPGIMLLSKLSAVYNVVALLVLIPLLGIVGAVIATGSAGVAKNLFIWWHVRRRARWTNFPVAVSLGLLLWGTAAAICLVLKAMLPVPPLAQLVIGAIVCGAFLLVHVRTGVISASDRQIMQSVLRGPEARIFRVAGLLRPAQ